MRCIPVLAVAVLLAGCAAPAPGTTSPTSEPAATSTTTQAPATTQAPTRPESTAPPAGSCRDPSRSYPAATAILYVTASGLMPPGHEPGPAANVTISAQAGGDGNHQGQEYARATTDTRGCVSFSLGAPGRYRFDTIPRATCDPAGHTVADWNGTAVLELHLAAGMPCS